MPNLKITIFIYGMDRGDSWRAVNNAKPFSNCRCMYKVGIIIILLVSNNNNKKKKNKTNVPILLSL